MAKKVIIIAGPTAAGKTAVALNLARQYDTEIISADSRQCYQEMSIGVAKPTATELAEIHHYFINTHSINKAVNAADFESYALQSVAEIFSTHDTAIMVGGTGLYIKAFCEGLDDIPAIDPLLREAINTRYKEEGLTWLQSELSKLDPIYYASSEQQNPHRLLRALEVVQATGNSISFYQTKNKKPRDFEIIKIGIAPPKEILQQQIDKRVNQMIDDGLVEEIRSLEAYKSFTPLQTVGYTEIFDYLDKKISLETAILNIKIHTRQYAKRQLTWFRKDPQIQWVQGGDKLPL